MNIIPKREKLNKYEILVPSLIFIEIILYNITALIQKDFDTELFSVTIYLAMLIGLFILLPPFSKFLKIRLLRRYTFLLWFIVCSIFAVTAFWITEGFSLDEKNTKLIAIKIMYLPILALIFFQLMRMVSILYLGFEPAYPHHSEIGQYSKELRRKIVEEDRGFGFVHSVLGFILFIIFITQFT
jgi:hypothetical protein